MTWQPCTGLYVLQDLDRSQGPCKRLKIGNSLISKRDWHQESIFPLPTKGLWDIFNIYKEEYKITSQLLLKIQISNKFLSSFFHKKIMNVAMVYFPPTLTLVMKKNSTNTPLTISFLSILQIKPNTILGTSTTRHPSDTVSTSIVFLIFNL